MNPLKLLDRCPVLPLAIAALALGLAPFLPRPHLIDKILLALDGALTRPADLLDVAIHAAPTLLLLLKWFRFSRKPVDGSPP